MARGLSDLQKFILREAAKKPVATQTTCYDMLCTYEICIGYYGWKPYGGKRSAADNNFDPDKIGRDKYNSVHVAIKKACDRLEKRGLVERGGNGRSWTGVFLTDRGREFVKSNGYIGRKNSGEISQYNEEAKQEPIEARPASEEKNEPSFCNEEKFNKKVDEIYAQLSEIKIYCDAMGKKVPLIDAEDYFALKEACERRVNSFADILNHCPDCKGLTGPVSKYDNAGKNFVIWRSMYNHKFDFLTSHNSPLR
jgi:hypothetical protein